MKKNIEKTKIVDIDTVCKLLGCVRSNVYNHYLKKGILTPVPRVSKKAYFYLSEVNSIINEKLADIAARKNLTLEETEMESTLVSQDFVEKHVEMIIK